MHTLPRNEPIVLVMVGLPARGKTYIARKLARYLNWLGVSSKVFNVGNYRRKHLGSAQPAGFFDPDNPEGYAARRRMALSALDDLVAWIRAGGQVALYDATNGTPERRQLVREKLAEHGLQPIFVESVCNDQALIEANIRETKLSMPDYAGMDADAAVRDFRARIQHYERAYRPVEIEEGSYVKLIDVGQQIHLNRMYGSLASRIVVFLMNLHIVPRPIFLMRHGESTFNPENRIGGDPPLTTRGWSFARKVGPFLQERLPGDPPAVWTSTLQRARQTTGSLGWPFKTLKNLDEIDAGEFDGWTYGQVKKHRPSDYDARKGDKLCYRYPRGESYHDVIERLEPVILELERQRGPVVVVAHQAVLRCLYGYLTNQPREACPHLEIPLHTVFELVPKAYGADEARTTLSVD